MRGEQGDGKKDAVSGIPPYLPAHVWGARMVVYTPVAKAKHDSWASTHDAGVYSHITRGNTKKNKGKKTRTNGRKPPKRTQMCSLLSTVQSYDTSWEPRGLELQ